MNQHGPDSHNNTKFNLNGNSMKQSKIGRRLSVLLALALAGGTFSSCQKSSDHKARPLVPPTEKRKLTMAKNELKLPQTISTLPAPAVVISPQTADQEEISRLIRQYLEKKQLDGRHLAVDVLNFRTQSRYTFNSSCYFTAASTYKLCLATLYYDLVAQSKVALSDTYLLDASMTDEGEAVAGTYKTGDSIPVRELLKHMVISSDNTAAHVLFQHLGGFDKFKTLTCSFLNIQPDQAYLQEGNLINAQILTACARAIYSAAQTTYKQLLEDMTQAQTSRYFNLLPPMQHIMAQKYGSFENAMNSVGFSLDANNPFSLVVLTDLGPACEQVLAEIAALIYAHYHPDKLQAEQILAQAEVFRNYPVYTAEDQPAVVNADGADN